MAEAEKRMKDQEIVLRAMRDAREVLGAYIEPGERDCEKTIDWLFNILNDERVVDAIDRLDRRYSMRIITVT